MPVFAVGFDFDHTLGFDHKLERDALIRLLDAVVVDGGHRLAGDLVALVDDLLVRERSGAVSIDQAVRDLVAPLLVDGQDADAYSALYRSMVLEMAADYVKPAPGAIALLKRLQSDGVALAILTNGWSPLQQKKAEIIGFHGPVLVSDRIGAQKPDPRAFAQLVSALRSHPSNVWYVGDNPVADIGGALAAGLRAVWVDEGTLAYPADLPPPTERVRSLGELAELFEAFA